jgi:hypothetical protein
MIINVLNFDGTNMNAGPKWEIIGSAVTNSSGVATFYITDNGLSTGNVLLSTIDYACPSTVSNAAQAINVPDAQMAELNLAGKYVSARARTMSGVVVLSINVLGSIGFVGAGTTIYFRVIGSPA